MAVTSARDKAGDNETLGPVRLLGQVDIVLAHDVGGHPLDGRSRNVLVWASCSLRFATSGKTQHVITVREDRCINGIDALSSLKRCTVCPLKADPQRLNKTSRRTQ